MKLLGIEFRSNFGKMIAWLIVLSILMGLLMAFFPFMLEESTKSLFDNFLNGLSPDLQAVFGLEEQIEFTNMSQYIAFIFQYIAVLIAMFAMQIGASSLAKEQSSGNIEYIYSNPIAKSEIVSDKILANILIYLLFLLLFAGATFGIAVIFQPSDIRKQEILFSILKIFIGLLGTGFVYMMIGYFLSSILKSSSATDGISVLLVLLSVILIIVGKLSNFGNITNYFALETFKPIHMLMGNIDLIGVGINLVILIIFLLLTYTVYNNKELRY